MPTELDALLDRAAVEWESDTVRLVIADWLSEHGQEDRAALIRLGVEQAALAAQKPHTGTPEHARLVELRYQVRELAKEVVPEVYWRKTWDRDERGRAVAGAAVPVTTRGWVEWAGLDLFVGKHWDRLKAYADADLGYWGLGATVGYRDLPHAYDSGGPEGFAAFVRAEPRLARIGGVRMVVSGHREAAEAVATLFAPGAPYLPALRRVYLVGLATGVARVEFSDAARRAVGAALSAGARPTALDVPFGLWALTDATKTLGHPGLARLNYLAAGPFPASREVQAPAVNLLLYGTCIPAETRRAFLLKYFTRHRGGTDGVDSVSREAIREVIRRDAHRRLDEFRAAMKLPTRGRTYSTNAPPVLGHPAAFAALYPPLTGGAPP